MEDYQSSVSFFLGNDEEENEELKIKVERLKMSLSMLTMAVESDVLMGNKHGEMLDLMVEKSKNLLKEV